MILRSEKLAALPGLQHAFSTRLGGVSAAPYATLNLGKSVGDEAAKVDENLRRFALLAGLPAPILQTSQVHGDAIAEAAPGAEADTLRLVEADAIFCQTPAKAVGVRTADCAPILFAATRVDGRVGAVAALHAGWRGATAGIVQKMVSRFAEAGFPATALTVAIGPTIGADAFEVGPEVIEAARQGLSGDVPPGFVGPNGRDHLDLTALLVLQLRRGGVEAARIDCVGGCTFENEAMFFSHRRDHGATGRHLSAIAYSSET